MLKKDRELVAHPEGDAVKAMVILEENQHLEVTVLLTYSLTMVTVHDYILDSITVLKGSLHPSFISV